MPALNCVVALPPPIECPADVIFVLDESGSIGRTNFNLMKSFLSQLVSRLDINSGNTRVGLVTFSGSVGTTINLDAHSSVASLQSAISSLVYAEGATNTDIALAHVRTRMLTSAAGDRSNVPNVVVVLTDGGSANPTATQVSKFAIKLYVPLPRRNPEDESLAGASAVGGRARQLSVLMKIPSNDKVCELFFFLLVW